MDDFYFAYEYDIQKKTASRLYRRINGQFERYNPNNRSWESASEQSCIYIGEDAMYDEISETDAKIIIESENILI